MLEGVEEFGGFEVKGGEGEVGDSLAEACGGYREGVGGHGGCVVQSCEVCSGLACLVELYPGLKIVQFGRDFVDEEALQDLWFLCTIQASGSC